MGGAAATPTESAGTGSKGDGVTGMTARCFNKIVALALPAGMLVQAMSAQTPQSTQATAVQPTFEVASVKPNKSGDGRVMLGFQPGGRFTATNVSLKMLMRTA